MLVRWESFQLIFCQESNVPSYLPGGNKSGGMHFGGEDFDPELWYWEANTAGKLRYPHSIQLVVGSFRELFGTELGRQLQAWCKLARPSSGSLPTVRQAMAAKGQFQFRRCRRWSS